MTSRAPGPDERELGQTDGKATASPSTAPARAPSENAHPAAAPKGPPTPLSFNVGIGVGTRGELVVAAQWTRVVPGRLIAAAPSGAKPDEYTLDLAARVGYYGTLIAKGEELLEVRREADTDETAVAHLNNARQILRALINSARDIAGPFDPDGELRVDELHPDSLQRQGANATLQYLIGADERVYKATILLRPSEIPAAQLGQAVAVNVPPRGDGRHVQ